MKEFIELHTFTNEGFTLKEDWQEGNFFLRYESIEAMFTRYNNSTKERYTKVSTKGNLTYYVTEWKEEIVKLIEEAKKS